ncbi:hypothetical protein MD484_g4253, partial [Candolleomyces efflorescens]
MSGSKKYVEWQIHLPGRSEDMPPMLGSQHHPLLEGVPLVRSVLVMLVKRDSRSMKAAYAFERAMDLPKGTPSQWREMELFDGDYVFVRDLNDHLRETDAGTLAQKDVLACATTGEVHHDQETKQEVDNAVQALVGKGEGGLTDFERMTASKNINNTRCFSIATTVEKQTKICAPAAAGNRLRDVEEYNKVTSKILKASSRMVVDIFKVLPSGVQRAISLNREVINYPSAGCFENDMAPNVQVNIATVNHQSQKSESDLQDDLGQFGEAHFDPNDHPAYLTVVLSASTLPDTTDPGYFHILQLGVFTKLDKHRGVVFSGRRKHGATKPQWTQDTVAIRPSAFRINVVFYPTNTCVNGQGRYPLAAVKTRAEKQELNGKEKDTSILFLTPETKNLSTCTDRQVNRATFATEGTNIMTPEAAANFYGRGGLEWLTQTLRLAEPSLQFSVDPDLFAQAITFNNSLGEREALKTWKHAPDAHFVRPIRVHAIEQFQRFTDRVSSFIPSVATHKTTGGQSENLRSTEATGGQGGHRGYIGTEESESVDAADEMEVESSLRITGDPMDVIGSDATRVDESHTTRGGNTRPAASSTRARGKSDSRRARVPKITAKDALKGTRGATETIKGSPRTNTIQSFKALDGLSLQAIEAEITRLRVELQTHGRGVVNNRTYERIPGGGDMEQLRSSFTILENDPVSADAPRRALEVHRQASSCEHQVLNAQLRTRADRAQIMLSASRARRWVEKDMVEATKDRLRETEMEKGTEARNWLDDIIAVVQNGFVDGRREIILDPEAYPRMLAIGNKPYAFSNTHAPRRYNAGDDREKLHEAIVNAIRVILPGWLGFSLPDGKLERNDRVRAWFVDAMQEYIGPKFLATDIAWTLFSTFKTGHVIRSDRIYRTYTPSPQLMLPFIEALKVHPICDSASDVGVRFREFSDLIDGECIPAPKPSLASTNLHNPEVDRFIRYIDVAYKILKGDRSEVRNPLVAEMIRDPDAHLPIRELVSDRRRSTGPDGPYDTEFIKTQAGLYSALVWRGVTEGTRFAQAGRMKFSDVDDIQDAIDEYARSHNIEATDLNAICERTVHGRYVETRSTSNILPIWMDTLTLQEWETFSRSSPTFGDCFYYLFGNNQGGRDKGWIGGLDTISMFNLVGDLVYAGVVQRPTSEEVARYMYGTKSPSFTALCEMGLISNNTTTIEEVDVGLRVLQGTVDSNIGQDDVQNVGTDLIRLEYALDRYIRFSNGLTAPPV